MRGARGQGLGCEKRGQLSNVEIRVESKKDRRGRHVSVTLFMKSQRHSVAGSMTRSSGRHRSHQGGGSQEVEWAGHAPLAKGGEKSLTWGNLLTCWTPSPLRAPTERS